MNVIARATLGAAHPAPLTHTAALEPVHPEGFVAPSPLATSMDGDAAAAKAEVDRAFNEVGRSAKHSIYVCTHIPTSCVLHEAYTPGEGDPVPWLLCALSLPSHMLGFGSAGVTARWFMRARETCDVTGTHTESRYPYVRVFADRSRWQDWNANSSTHGQLSGPRRRCRTA